jgi:phytoene dehydrogenase-like protein
LSFPGGITARTVYVAFEGLAAQAFDETDVKAKVRKVVPAVQAAADKAAEGHRSALQAAAEAFDTAMALLPDRTQWATNATQALKTLRKALATADVELTDKQDQLVSELRTSPRRLLATRTRNRLPEPG